MLGYPARGAHAEHDIFDRALKRVYLLILVDSGVTLSYLKNYLMVRKPASISIVTLMDKPARRNADVYADYSCFEVPDAFVVGYGLDYNERYRNLPYIGVLKPEIYS